jgi:hypothetical protein
MLVRAWVIMVKLTDTILSVTFLFCVYFYIKLTDTILSCAY